MTYSREQRRAHDRPTGFGLVELMFAVVLASLGLVTAAGVSLGMGSQTALARWDTDQALAARGALEAAARGGYAAATSGSSRITVGTQSYAVAQSVTQPAPRLKHVRLTVASSAGRAPADFETRLAQPRPLPVAP